MLSMGNGAMTFLAHAATGRVTTSIHMPVADAIAARVSCSTENLGCVYQKYVGKLVVEQGTLGHGHMQMIQKPHLDCDGANVLSKQCETVPGPAIAG